MIALLNPGVWLVLLGLLLGAYGSGRWQQWRSDEKDIAAASLKESERARQTEANWQTNADAQEELHDEELRRIAAQHVRDLDGVRNRSARLLEVSRPACNGATGAELSNRDAGDLVSLAARADVVRADLAACQGWAKALTGRTGLD